MKIQANHVHVVLEDDMTLHNRMLETLSATINSRSCDKYEISDSFKALAAVARLIVTKAEKQIFLINTGESDQS